MTDVCSLAVGLALGLGNVGQTVGPLALCTGAITCKFNDGRKFCYEERAKCVTELPPWTCQRADGSSYTLEYREGPSLWTLTHSQDAP